LNFKDLFKFLFKEKSGENFLVLNPTVKFPGRHYPDRYGATDLGYACIRKGKIME